jgi:hypothetical protein
MAKISLQKLLITRGISLVSLFFLLQVIILLTQFVCVEEKVQLIEMLIIIDFRFLLFVKVVFEPN